MGSLGQNQLTCMNCKFVGWRQQPCNGSCPCTISGQDIQIHVINNDCPKGFYKDGIPEKPEPSRVTEGRKRWKAYHLRALSWNGNDLVAEQKYRSALANGLQGCGCQDEWSKYISSTPLVVTNAMEYFVQTVADHNYVNNALGKPLLSVQEALSLYMELVCES